MPPSAVEVGVSPPVLRSSSENTPPERKPLPPLASAPPIVEDGGRPMRPSFDGDESMYFLLEYTGNGCEAGAIKASRLKVVQQVRLATFVLRAFSASGGVAPITFPNAPGNQLPPPPLCWSHWLPGWLPPSPSLTTMLTSIGHVRCALCTVGRSKGDDAVLRHCLARWYLHSCADVGTL